MGKHKKKKAVVVAPSQQQQQLSPEQKQEQEMNELLRVYSPERREAMIQQILQRKKQKD